MAARRRKRAARQARKLPQWKINLARSRIRAFGFPKEQREDLLHRLVLEMLRFRFDPAKANGATESTALWTLINNQLSTVARTRDRERERVEACGSGPGRLADGDGLALSLEEQCSLKIDVRRALTTLTPFEKAVCAGLARGDSKNRLAEDLGASWHRVDRAVAAIRVRFRRLGLEGYLCE